ncbi:metal ABC transporter substrate-binding protein [Streptococcus chenjunshii]|uniref:Metal ABC transporter substrate-binding protein n=1 Tax=Streptococcus chenjunshii TaxID=2173853 RepID=A0A372KK75_9STRE|nr:metal ABC transporter substrate-binding protein [Streptococcus chenjunshii]AXQ78023.1 metal ABC transporter substrate-binding protein [Streptococcus chenjunshii]RFU50435.1 metal ABC transporter substrate-binding protein [Streptococcus chenjunshii]RFU52663.1 metal ABC transporter substrate-binding protein [Streptococcus chenjunshii]
MKKKITVIVSLLVLGFVVSACSVSGQKTGNNKLKVVVTNSIIADITKNIAGDKIDLHSIVPVGKDPHEYEPLPEDIQKAAEADLIFYNGMNLETGGNAWFRKLINNTGKKKNHDYCAVSEGIKPIYLEGASGQGKVDPHAWLSLANGIAYAENICRQLSAKDSSNKAYYNEQCKAYIAKLEKLDQEAKEKLAAIARDKRLVVTSEGCLKYFSQAYDLPSAYIWEINTEEEGTPDQIRSLVERLKEQPPSALFVESSVDSRPMETVAKESGIPIYAKLFTDSVAEKGKAGDSYYAMMKWNIDKIAAGLSQ